ncbi:MAG TPA: hypothetical protein VIL99_18930 [Ignavibacteria bacterium]
MRSFDDKQKDLINSWHKISKRTDGSYMAFMSEWIAFNAICYNLYYEAATIERANINRDKSKLSEIEEQLSLNNIKKGTAIIKAKNGKLEIDLEFPERIFFSITRKYTEDIIYNLFVKEYQTWYNKEQQITFPLFLELKRSLIKSQNGIERSYVNDMSRIKEYSSWNNIEEMNERNIIILCEENNLKTIKKVLYQIRCNIFHGEKPPWDKNDDRIVKSSFPLLTFLVEKLMKDNNIHMRRQNN